MILRLIRHAHADTGNPPRLCGTLDVPLSSKGRRQLEAFLAHRQSDPRPAALYSSPLARAAETAVALGGLWNVPARFDRAFREIDCGSLEGVPIPQIEREYGELWQRNLAQTDDSFAWPGGESYAQFRGRIIDGITVVAARHPGEHVAVVTHTGVITQILGILKGRSAAVWEQDRPDPLSLTEIAWRNGCPSTLRHFNQRDWL